MSNNYTIPGTTSFGQFQANVGTILTSNLNIGAAVPASVVPQYQIYPSNNFNITGAMSASTQITTDGLTLQGNADIKFGNISLKDFMEKVSMRLNMMVPHPELERQWDELRVLGEAYRACEKECIEKAKVWDILRRDE